MNKLFDFLSKSDTEDIGLGIPYLFSEFLSELEWEKLSHEEMMQQRLSDANLFQRWGSDDLHAGAKIYGWSQEELARRVNELEDTYSLALVDVHKDILLLLNYIKKYVNDDTPYEYQDITFVLLKGLLLMEKRYKYLVIIK